MSSALLLGPGYPDGQLEFREEIKRLVEKDGGREALIMEQICNNTKMPLHKAFEKLLQVKNPDFIVAIYTKEGIHNAVDFELGTLTCHFEELKKKILILTHRDLPEKIITSYLTEGLYYEVINLGFDTAEEAAERIIKFMNTEVR